MPEGKDVKLATDKVLAHVTNGVGHVIFNNPERHNAVSLDMWCAVEEALSAFLTDKNVRVVVFSGTGGKSFVSGADISKFDYERGSKESVSLYNTRVKSVYDTVENLTKPTIAMINGYCMGGGLNLAVCTDFRIESTK